jgi:multidrug efflux pump subunit AcrA (membrane-fusion protein)
MSFVKYIVSGLIFMGAIGIAMWLISLRQAPPNKNSGPSVPTVDVTAVEAYTGPLEFSVSGTVVPFREIKIAAEVGGMIVEKSPECKAGTYVSQGTVLMRIDPQTYELEISTLKAELKQSESSIVETTKEIEGLARQIEIKSKEVEILQAEYQRNVNLQGAVSISELQQSERAVLAAEAQLSSLENNLATATARSQRLNAGLELSNRKLERAELNLSKTTIVAPEDGVVVKENVEKGEIVAAGTQLLTFEDTRRTEVVCNLSKSDLDWIRRNANQQIVGPNGSKQDIQSAYQIPRVPVNIFDAREPDVIWSGVVERVDGIGWDEMTKTIPIRIGVSSPVIDTEYGKRALVRGMFVKCSVQIPTTSEGEASKYLVFPTKALRPGNFIWVVDNDRKLRRTAPTLVDQIQVTMPVQSIDGKSTVSSNVEMSIARADDQLKAGEWVMISPMPQPTEGALVRFSTDPSPSADEQVANGSDASAVSASEDAKSGDTDEPATAASSQADGSESDTRTTGTDASQ